MPLLRSYAQLCLGEDCDSEYVMLVTTGYSYENFAIIDIHH